MRDQTERQKTELHIQRLQVLSDAARNLLEAEDPLELLDRTYDGLAAAFGLKTFTPELIGLIRALVDMVATAIARHQAEEAEQAHAANFRLAVEAAPNGMVMVNEEGIITMVNADMERLFGYDRSEMLGQPIEMLLPERYRESHPAQRQYFFASPEARELV